MVAKRILAWFRRLYRDLPVPLMGPAIKIQVLLGIKKPIRLARVFFALTYRCNAGCPMCSIANYKSRKNELGTGEVKSVIDQLRRISVDEIRFFGGEPLLRKDLVELVRYTATKGIKPTVFTNGYLLSEKKVKELKDAGIWQVWVGIDSPCCNDHNTSRKLPGCFENAVRGIKHCVKSGIKVTIVTVATKSALKNGDVETIIHLGKELKASKVHISTPSMIGGWMHAKGKMLDSADYKKIAHLTRDGFADSEVKELCGNMYRQCLVKAKVRMYISCYGDVQPCWALPLSFGNVRETPLAEILGRMHRWMSRQKFSAELPDCLVNDEQLRQNYMRNANSNTQLPIRINEP